MTESKENEQASGRAETRVALGPSAVRFAGFLEPATGEAGQRAELWLCRGLTTDYWGHTPKGNCELGNHPCGIDLFIHHSLSPKHV